MRISDWSSTCALPILRFVTLCRLLARVELAHHHFEERGGTAEEGAPHLGELNVRCIGCEHHLAEGVPLVIEQVRHHGEVRRRRVARPALLRLARATFVSIGHLLGLLLPEAVCLRHPEALPARLTSSEAHTSELQSLM